mmetsp:Transcript_25848/g.43059  ORF Transcript_25848/g.43059 Transcript_25848/m.43059 type:complete len:484 (+) Transcript_25848:92-1543(+)|eukprot:CAMPEP_0119014798 /NCGR_PEP_ID=MMETSP1176-20130426/10392_1 /TAXON_ID=265551 /ORGANISM="Synedropsis recta cf, Strain CCMP1620" /LENGTH=483 /DNA_ID=CAMNT_0006968041 /DNA_START=92 /DNA_END=1543 /DNA_ORIENTATION=-
MSSGYGGTDSFLQTLPRSKSPGASFGSFNVDNVDDDSLQVTHEDVDDLLTALEASANESSFLKAHDDDFVKEMLEGEKQGEFDHPAFLTQGENHVLDDILTGQNSLPSLGGSIGGSLGGSINGLEPLGLDEMPSDPNLLAVLADDPEFQQNSTKLNDFIQRSTMSDTLMDLGSIGNFDKSDPDPMIAEQEPAAAQLYPEMMLQPTSTGKRRRAPRRGSLPNMHLRYEDPFEPTPIPHADPDPEDEPPAKLAAVPVDDIGAFSLPPGGRRRAQRRGSLPTMHLNCGGTSSSFIGMGGGDHNSHIQHQATNHHENQQQQQQQQVNFTPADVNEEEFAPRKMGRMPRRGSTGSYFSGASPSMFGDGTQSSTLGLGNVSTTVPENLDPEVMMKKLQDLMEMSVNTQQSLQKWDKDNGLPKSHSQTMVNTSRSRKQLQSGVILPKWDGTPLISEETELGKPKPRNKAFKNMEGKMKRRMSAPASSAFF